jgi:cell division protease FtsH
MPEEDRYNYSESYLRDRIAVMFGGRLAESIVFGEVSNGAESDLEQATRLARRMVSRWGMSERLGPASFGERGDNVFLGQQMAREHEVSDATAAAIDEEIQTLLRDIERRARELLEQHRDGLEALAEALQDDETLEADEVREILDRAGAGRDD